MVKKRKGSIPRPEVPPLQAGLRFSFCYLQQDHSKFPIEACLADFFHALLKQIARYEGFSYDQFTEHSQDEKRHPIIFADTTEPDGFPNIDPASDELWTDEGWQFGLKDGNGRQTLWRVHGFIENGTFYIVWLDPGHKLYLPARRGPKPKVRAKKKA
jgi:hypothetical protein